jgi:hypothetical protein
MNGEKRLLVTDEAVEFEKKPVEVQDFREYLLRIILEEFIEYTPI